jgi:hypothetical protein
VVFVHLIEQNFSMARSTILDAELLMRRLLLLLLLINKSPG